MPCLKFFASFTNDVVFFISYTFLSQPGHYGFEFIPKKWLFRAHLLWCSGILLNEVGEYISSRAGAIPARETVTVASHLPSRSTPLACE